MKKIFIFIFLTKIAYAMDPQEHVISSQRIEGLFNNNILQNSRVQFNLRAKDNESPYKLKINLITHKENKNVFFHCGPKLNTLLKRLQDNTKHEAILNEAKEYNLQNNIALETDTEWNSRNSKNKKKYTWLQIASKNEKYNVFNPVVFMNVFNNAINQDNPKIQGNIFEIQIHINEKAYQETYNVLPDSLKQLFIIHENKIATLKENLTINDIDEYEQIQNNIVIQKEKEEKESEEKRAKEQEKKRREIEESVYKKKEEGKSDKTNDIAKEKLRSENYFRTEDIIAIWKELNKKIETRINKEIKEFGEIQISIRPFFDKKFCYHGDEFKKYIDSLNEYKAYVLSSLLSSSNKNTEFIKTIKSETEDLSFTLPRIFNNFLIALIQDSIENLKNNPKASGTNITSIDSLFLGQNGIGYLYRKNKQQNFREITTAEFKEIFYRDHNRIDNLIDSELNFFIEKIKEILQQRHYVVEIK